MLGQMLLSSPKSPMSSIGTTTLDLQRLTNACIDDRDRSRRMPANVDGVTAEEVSDLFQRTLRALRPIRCGGRLVIASGVRG